MNKYLSAYYGDDLVDLVMFLRRKTCSGDITRTILEYAMGMVRWRYTNGQLRSESTHKNGRRHGLYRMWYENDQLFEEATYKDGNRHGLHKSWDVYGELIGGTTYMCGLIQSLHCVGNDGKLRVVGQITHRLLWR